MTIKVLHVYRTYFPDTQGGVEEVIRQIAEGVGSQIESRVFSLSSSVGDVEVDKSGRIQTIRVPQAFEIASTGFFFKGIGEFIQQCRWADVIHYHYPWPYADLLHFLYVKKLGKKTVVTYHSDIVRQKFLGFIYRPLMGSFLSSVDSIVATSPNYAVSSPVLSKYKNKLSIIPLGIDEASYPVVTVASVSLWKEKFGKPFFFFIGVHRYYKGLDVLLLAMKDAPYNLVVAGEGPETEMLKLLRERHLLDNVYFLGRVSDQDKMDLMAASLGFILPSNERSEAFGVCLLEASMSHKPMITVDIGTGTTFVNMDGETGLVASEGKVDLLRACMDRLVENPIYTTRCGAAARLRYESMFTGSTMCAHYSDLYGKLITIRAE